MHQSLSWESSLFSFSVSLVIPQFELLSHVSFPQIVLRAFRPCPYSKNRLCSPCLPVQPLLTGDRRKRPGTCLLKLWLGAYSVGFFFFLPVMFPSEIPKLPTDPPVRGYLLCGNFSSFTTPSPGQVSIPNSFVSVFVFYICPTSF